MLVCGYDDSVSEIVITVSTAMPYRRSDLGTLLAVCLRTDAGSPTLPTRCKVLTHANVVDPLYPFVEGHHPLVAKTRTIPSGGRLDS
jgi:hypothetical protein